MESSHPAGNRCWTLCALVSSVQPRQIPILVGANNLFKDSLKDIIFNNTWADLENTLAPLSGPNAGLASQTHETVIWQMLWLGLKRMEPVLISTGAGCYINFVSSFEFSTGTGFYTKPFFIWKSLDKALHCLKGDRVGERGGLEEVCGSRRRSAFPLLLPINQVSLEKVSLNQIKVLYMMT